LISIDQLDINRQDYLLYVIGYFLSYSFPESP